MHGHPPIVIATNHNVQLSPSCIRYVVPPRASFASSPTKRYIETSIVSSLGFSNFEWTVRRSEATPASAPTMPAPPTAPQSAPSSVPPPGSIEPTAAPGGVPSAPPSQSIEQAEDVDVSPRQLGRVHLLTIAGLMAWAEEAVATLGTERFEIVLELGAATNLISSESRDVLARIAKLVPSNKSMDEPMNVIECLVVLRQLEAILQGENIAKIPLRRSAPPATCIASPLEKRSSRSEKTTTPCLPPPSHGTGCLPPPAAAHGSKPTFGTFVPPRCAGNLPGAAAEYGR